MPERPTSPQKIPLVFFRTSGGGEPVREWLKALPEPERQAIGRDLLRTQMAVAGGYATMQADGQRPVGDSYRSADEAKRTGAAMRLQEPFGRVTWFHQENSSDAG